MDDTSIKRVVRRLSERKTKPTRAELRSILLQIMGDGYCQGVTAGKKEAIKYSTDEKIAYVKHVSFNEGFVAAKDFLASRKKHK